MEEDPATKLHAPPERCSQENRHCKRCGDEQWPIDLLDTSGRGVTRYGKTAQNRTQRQRDDHSTEGQLGRGTLTAEPASVREDPTA